MVREAQDAIFDQTQVIKGKRSKRPRRRSTSGESCGSGGCSGRTSDSSSTSLIKYHDKELTMNSEDEAHLANSLILLSHGQTDKSHNSYLYGNYQCKTGDKSFSSFQALGGHRAAQKKPKPPTEDNKMTASTLVEEERNHSLNTTKSEEVALVTSFDHNSKKSNKVHECSTCGAGFESGQALGGHMRRHRPINQESKEARKVLQLDLNLPAPEDDDDHQEFFFSSKQIAAFTASSLVGCHY